MINNLVKKQNIKMKNRIRAFFKKFNFLKEKNGFYNNFKIFKNLDSSVRKKNIKEFLINFYHKIADFVKKITNKIKNIFLDFFFGEKSKHFIKKLLSNDTIQYVLTFLVSLYIRFVYFTSKVVVKGHTEDYINSLQQKKPTVVLTWHGRIFISAVFIEKWVKKIAYEKKLLVLSSGHKDGEIASKIMKFFNFEKIEGSTVNRKKLNRKEEFNSIRSVLQIIKELKNNSASIFLAPDGPRGPKYKLNSNIVWIAKKTNAKIFPAVISYAKKKQLNSWDEFQIPFPFSKIIIEFLEPIAFNEDSNIEKISKDMVDMMNEKMMKNDKTVLL